jgi:flotillin
MLRDAQNAENEALQVVSEAQAGARQRAESAQQQAESLVLQKRNGFRAEMAKLEAEAKSIENEAQVAAETARATAEQEMQKLRAELAKLRLQVETVLPAEASALALSARARGEAAPTIENGKAAAEALAVVAAEWAQAGAYGREVYVLSQLDKILAAAVKRVQQLEVGALEIVDGGDASNVVAVLGSFAQGVAKVLDEMGRAMGVDVRALIGPRGPGSPAPGSFGGHPQIPGALPGGDGSMLALAADPATERGA